MLRFIDQSLNKVSMYRLVSISLTLLFLYSLLLSLIGTSSYDLGTLVGSAGVLVGAVYFASLACGKIFGVSIHSESSFITAMILFFIMRPSLDAVNIASLVIVGLLAGSSKFLLTYHGRHIFNPVAISSGVVGLAGLSYATWWVGTPSMLVPTLIFSVLILYKTRRIVLGFTFLLVASLLILTSLVTSESSISESIGLLASWPLLFFAGFMLSEPLTLPIKKKQQIFEAIVVAVLFALPFRIAGISSSLSLALVAGNLIAFFLTRRESVYLTLVDTKQLTPSTVEFAFQPSKKIKYLPGQYMDITLPHKSNDGRGERRAFSITSIPSQENVRFAIKFYEPSSTYKKALKQLPHGAHVQVADISGEFTLPQNPAIPLLFIAGGIGITPFISLLALMSEKKENRDVIIIYVISNTAEFAFQEELAHSKKRVHIVVQTESEAISQWNHINQQRLTTSILEQTVPDISARSVYISGPPAMISDTKKQLKELQVRKIKSDYFTGY